MLLLNLIYLFSERQTVAMFLNHKLTWAFIILFGMWPLLGAVYPMFQGYSMLRHVVLQMFYTTTVLGVGALIINEGFARFRLLLYISFAVSIVGLFAQMFFPSFFMSIALMSEESGEVFAYGRSGGFFVNPNVAGRFVILLYLLLMLSPKKLSAIEILLVTPITFGGVLLTASRSSLLLSILVIGYVLGHRFAVPYIRGRLSVNPVRVLSGMALVMIVGALMVVTLPIASSYVLNKTSVGATRNASQRFDFFAHGFDGFVERVEEEALGRWHTVEPYVPGFQESWLFGRGLAGYYIYKIENHLQLTPHNTIFAMWMNYGVCYVLFGLFCFISVTFSPRMRMIENHLGMIFMPILFITLVGIMFTYDGLMAQRGFYVMIGAFLALYCASPRWFEYDHDLASQPLLKARRRKSPGRGI